ncbi:MAG: hypothetical protein NPIRA05_20190 [Nitrospirales bacterium]|nr:MAG: hypothetical protein NPIRA05_20190 [Nitrospirales bacterium]
MKKTAVADQVFRVSLPCLGFMFVVMSPLAEPVFGDDSNEAPTDEIQSKDRSGNSSPSMGDKTKDSPILGEGVRTPPDIGASGTASSTPPVGTESPTDDPQILPDISPVPTHPLNSEMAPINESEPLGQPNHLKNTPEE